MSSIIEKIKKIEKLYHAKGCTMKQVKEAQSELEITFPEDYIDIVENYIDFGNDDDLREEEIWTQMCWYINTLEE